MNRSSSDMPGRRPGPPPLPPRTGSPPAQRRTAAPRPARRAPPPPRRTWPALLGYSVLGLGCILASAVAFLVVAAPVDLIRDRIVERVKARSGLDLTIAGGASLSLFPKPGLSLAEVALASPRDGAAPLLTATRLDADVSLWSLFGTGPVVDQLTVHSPTIDLDAEALDAARARPRPAAADATADPAQAPSAAAAPTDTASPNATARSRPGLETIRLNVVDGTVRYRGRGGDVTEASSVQLTLFADGPDAPLTIKGSTSIKGAPIAISGTVSPGDALARRQPARVTLNLQGSPFVAAYEGTLSLADGLSLDGSINVEAGSLAALGTWLGQPLARAGEDDALAFSADLKSSRDRISLSKLNAKLGNSTLSGALALDTSGPRRRLTGSLEASELDFGRLLLQHPGRNRRAEPRAAAAAEPAPGPNAAVAAPIPPPARIARRSGPRDWSDDPINLSLFGLADVDLKLAAQRVIYKDLETGPSRLTVRLDAGAGNMWVEEVQLYGGKALGQVALDATGNMLVVGVNLRLDRVDLRPLLEDALDVPWLEGRASLDVALAGQGTTERQIIGGLNGKIELESRDGAITGADVGKIVRDIQNMKFSRLALSPSEKTAYSELASTFAVTNGVASTNDMRLLGPHVELKGEGTLDLSQRRVDTTLNTKVGAAPDPNARLKLGQIQVPITIVGPWDKPEFGIKGQEQLSGAIRQIGKNLRSRDVKDAIRGLLEGNGEKRVKPRDILNQLLKKD